MSTETLKKKEKSIPIKKMTVEAMTNSLRKKGLFIDLTQKRIGKPKNYSEIMGNRTLGYVDALCKFHGFVTYTLN